MILSFQCLFSNISQLKSQRLPASMSRYLWFCLPSGCTRALNSGRWEEGTAAAGGPPPTCACDAPLGPTCAGGIPTRTGRLWPERSQRGAARCPFCLCLSPNGFDILGNIWVWFKNQKNKRRRWKRNAESHSLPRLHFHCIYQCKNRLLGLKQRDLVGR